VRLPTARLQSGLQSGLIDARVISSAVLDLPGTPMDHLATPRDANGHVDLARGLLLYTVVFVRAGDGPARGTDTAAYFRDHRLGTYHGAGIAAALRQAGYEVDDGAADMARNIEKLLRRRIDGYALSVAALDDMDADVASRYGGALLRLDQPLRTNRLLLVFNRDYYERHRASAEAMWQWLGEHGQARSAQLLKNYQK